ncbi:MAG: Hsp33 family molecular chaperone HslO [Glaciecola sp.]
MTDILDRFLFVNRPIRGEIVSLSDSYQQILASASYPEPVQQLLGELMTAASLLTATLKFEGEIALQIQSEGPIRYAIINGTHDQKLRGVAKWNTDLEVFPEQFSDWFTKGVLAITLTPKDGQRYQGIVALDKPSLSACIEDYFLQSEQLLTSVYLTTKTTEPQQAAGLLIQVVPTSSESSNVENNPDFEHISCLANTISQEEVLSLDHKTMIHRLYHEEDLRIYEPQSVKFECDCSKARSAQALRNVSKQELLQIIEEDGKIEMDCQFCHANYVFDAIDVENIHAQNLNSGSA